MNKFSCFIGRKLAADISSCSKILLSMEISIKNGGKIDDFSAIIKRVIHAATFRIKLRKSLATIAYMHDYFLKIAFSLV